MKTFIALIVVVILAGGGWYLYSLQAPAAETPTPNDAASGTQLEGTPTNDDMGPTGDTKTSFTLAEVQAHASAASCWSIVNGMVYDLTAWIPLHPGGEAKIKALCGKDGTASFTGQHGGQEKPEATLASFKIGEFVK